MKSSEAKAYRLAFVISHSEFLISPMNRYRAIAEYYDAEYADKEMLRQLGALVRTGPYIAQAPLAIVVGMEHTPYAVSDASRAIQSMILTAWSQGIGSNWTGFDNLKHINPVLGIPQEIEILSILPFGYPAATLGKGRKRRKPLGEVAHRERWNQPFA